MPNDLKAQTAQFVVDVLRNSLKLFPFFLGLGVDRSRVNRELDNVESAIREYRAAPGQSTQAIVLPPIGGLIQIGARDPRFLLVFLVMAALAVTVTLISEAQRRASRNLDQALQRLLALFMVSSRAHSLTVHDLRSLDRRVTRDVASGGPNRRCQEEYDKYADKLRQFRILISNPSLQSALSTERARKALIQALNALYACLGVPFPPDAHLLE